MTLQHNDYSLRNCIVIDYRHSSAITVRYWCYWEERK